MQIKVDEELKQICRQIIDTNSSLEEWKKRESDDDFQTKHYVGGFDAIEEAFCFSYYDDTGKEYWIQLSLSQIKEILDDKIQNIKVVLPE